MKDSHQTPEDKEELKVIDKLFNEFERTHGMKVYEALKAVMSKLYQKIDDLLESRAKWRERAISSEIQVKELKGR
jgi:hypothetical protein